MEEIKDPKSRILELAGEVVETYRRLITVSVVEHASHGVSLGLIGFIAVVFSGCVLLFVALGSAWWVGERMNNMKAGFFIVGSAFVILLIIIILVARKIFIPQIRNMIIRRIYEKDQ